MAEVILFGGTTEGREIGLLLYKKGIQTLVCVATEYGRTQIDPFGFLQVCCGRLDKTAMETLFSAQNPRLVIDATHPYAGDVTENIRAASDSCGIKCLRVLREEQFADNCELFSVMDDLIDWTSSHPGVIFSSLGAKEAMALTRVSDFSERVWLRILPEPEGLAYCLSLGYQAKHIICMQGPFSAKMNTAMFRAAGANILLTKASGKAGGFIEKIEAARLCGMHVAVLSRPYEKNGLTMAEIKWEIEGMAK